MNRYHRDVVVFFVSSVRCLSSRSKTGTDSESENWLRQINYFPYPSITERMKKRWVRTGSVRPCIPVIRGDAETATETQSESVRPEPNPRPSYQAELETVADPKPAGRIPVGRSGSKPHPAWGWRALARRWEAGYGG